MRSPAFERGRALARQPFTIKEAFVGNLLKGGLRMVGATGGPWGAAINAGFGAMDAHARGGGFGEMLTNAATNAAVGAVPGGGLLNMTGVTSGLTGKMFNGRRNADRLSRWARPRQAPGQAGHGPMPGVAGSNHLPGMIGGR